VRSWIEANVDRLYGYAYSLTQNREEARDLVHDAVIRAMEASHKPVEGAGCKAWMFRILRNAFIDCRRRAGVVIPFGLPDDVPCEPGLAWTGDNRMVDILTVRLALEKLPIMQREIIVLVDCVGCTYAEAARVLDIPDGTVMSRLSRARKALLDLVQEGNVTPIRRAARSGGVVM